MEHELSSNRVSAPVSEYLPTAMPAPDTINADDFSPSELKQYIAQAATPQMIKGFAAHWELVKAHNVAHINPALVLQAFAQHSTSQNKVSLVRVPQTQHQRMFYKPDLQSMNFGTAQVSLLQALQYIAQQPDQASYAVQCVPLDTYFSALTSQCSHEAIEQDARAFAWLGNALKVAPHFDDSDNIAVVVAGRRRFTLFPPEQVGNLYVGPLHITPAGQPISLVDITQPDLNAHPRYIAAYQHGLSCELAPGDAIYIPSPWWHHVQSLSPVNVLINYWWGLPDVSTASPYPAMLHAIQAMSAMSDAQKQAWHGLFKHYVFAAGEQTAGHLPSDSLGPLGEMSDEDRRVLDAFIKAQL